jgi:hypothetical protein
MTTATSHRPGFFTDVYAGTVRGDFSPYLGFWGRVAQIVCGFVPGVNIICATRDFIADRRMHDNFGAFLNALALIPFLGGFPKTAAVIRGVRHVGHVVHKAGRHDRQDQQSPTETTYSA